MTRCGTAAGHRGRVRCGAGVPERQQAGHHARVDREVAYLGGGELVAVMNSSAVSWPVQSQQSGLWLSPLTTRAAYGKA